jgi:hypothetical protein
MNKKDYLIVFMTRDFKTDFFIISGLSGVDAKQRAEKLPKVLSVLSVWEKVNE